MQGVLATGVMFYAPLIGVHVPWDREIELSKMAEVEAMDVEVPVESEPRDTKGKGKASGKRFEIKKTPFSGNTYRVCSCTCVPNKNCKNSTRKSRMMLCVAMALSLSVCRDHGSAISLAARAPRSILRGKKKGSAAR